jgi:hypothetical protein
MLVERHETMEKDVSSLDVISSTLAKAFALLHIASIVDCPSLSSS